MRPSGGVDYNLADRKSLAGRDLATKGKAPRASDDLVDWFTVTYKSIYTALAIVVLIAGGVGYYYWAKNRPVEVPAVDPVVVLKHDAGG